jgi:spore coat polysaccharide biosynthesis protein SpsF
MRICAFIQVRMGSTRLPGKALKMFGQFPLIQWVIHRVKLSNKLSDLVAILPTGARDDELEAFITKSLDCKVFRGPEHDVLSRFTNALVEFPCEHVLRVCADNPFICPNEIDRLIDFHISGNFDYSFNHVPKLENKYADGFGGEILKAGILREIESSVGTNPIFREHVTSFIWEHFPDFNIGLPTAPPSIAYPELKFDIDTLSDFERLSKLLSRININSSAEEIVFAWRSQHLSE